MSEIEDYVRATSIQEACEALLQPGQQVIAGGTDILLKAPRMNTPPIRLVDISNIPELKGISVEGGYLRIGAATRLADIVRSPLLKSPALSALVSGAVSVGSPQIRNLATLGGNLCNAAPSADTSAPLLVLNASAEVESTRGPYKIPLNEFFLGPGQTVLKPGDLLVSITIPIPSAEASAVYLKHSPRRAMDLAVVGVAAFYDPKTPRQLRIALGAVAPTPIRLPEVEKYLLDASTFDDAALSAAARMAAQTARPISDVRSSAGYRTSIVEILTKRALKQVIQR